MPLRALDVKHICVCLCKDAKQFFLLCTEQRDLVSRKKEVRSIPDKYRRFKLLDELSGVERVTTLRAKVSTQR